MTDARKSVYNPRWRKKPDENRQNEVNRITRGLRDYLPNEFFVVIESLAFSMWCGLIYLQIAFLFTLLSTKQVTLTSYLASKIYRIVDWKRCQQSMNYCMINVFFLSPILLLFFSHCCIRVCCCRIKTDKSTLLNFFSFIIEDW